MSVVVLSVFEKEGMEIVSKYLIVTADDFGISEVTNEAIEELAEKGRITSTSFILPGKAIEDAVERSSRMSHIDFGLHITLLSDSEIEKWKSYTSRKMLGPLVDQAGYFHERMETFLEHANSAWVMTEIAAQFCYGESLGLKFDHMNSQSGILYDLSGKSFLPIAIHFCAGHRLPFRFPKELIGLEYMLGDAVNDQIKKAHNVGAEFATIKKVPLPDLVLTNPFSVKEIPSYNHLKQFYLSLLKKLPEGVTELFLHPSKETDGYFGQTPEWQKRVWDYHFLLDDDFSNLLIEEKIQLVTWKEAFEIEKASPE